jgi:hypothetical protein
MALGAILSAGCAEDSSLDSVGTSVPITAMSIDPMAFLNDVPCSSKPGSLQSYVVTLLDITDESRTVTLPSTDPIPCSRSARFRFILAENKYIAEVDGYDVAADALVPAGTPPPEDQTADPGTPQGLPGSGSRHMLLNATKAPITPRWTSTCDARTSRAQATIGFDKCSALTDHGSPAPTSIAVDPKAALGDLRCASAGGEIATLDIKPVGAALPSLLGVPCGADPVVFDAGLVPGQVYSFRLEARAEVGGEVRWGSTCFAAAEEALQTSAACDPLASTGSVEVGPAALAAAGLKCEGDIKAFQATIEPLGVSSGPVPCGESARFLAIEPGMYDVILRQVGPSGPEAFGVTCAAVVAPGSTSKVACMSAP